MKMVTVPTAALMEMIRLQLEKGGRANLTVTGSSMLPMLRQHTDSVILAPAKGKLLPGDIALYQDDGGNYILHRVIRVGEGDYLFCGDNQYQAEIVPQNRVLAVVTEYTKSGKIHKLTEPGCRIYRWLLVRLFGVRKYYITLRRWLGYLRRGRRNSYE